MGEKNRFYVDIMALHPEVTGSCNLVIVKFPNGETIRFIVDCGLFQEQLYDELNYSLAFNAENIDFCLITHNHTDHIGRLPYIVRKGFHNSIYATEDTCKLMSPALMDSTKVLRDIAKRKNEKCLYDDTDVERTKQLLKKCEYEKTIKINQHIKATFFTNGHLVGAACILVQIKYPGYDDINLLFTGDYNNKNIFTEVKPIPKWVLKLPLTIIQESTYGNMNSNEIKPCFKDNVLECLNNEGTVVTLVFSLGRAQEILYELKKLQQSGELPVDIPIYFDGKLAKIYTEMYRSGNLHIKEDMKDFIPSHLGFNNVDNELRTALLQDEKRKIIVTTSGMGSYGPAQTYIPEYITRKNALIQFTGYTAEGTLGRRLKDTKNGETVQVGGLIAKKRARVEYTNEFSAHAKADEMIDFLKQFENLKLVLVNHGEEKVKEKFAERIVDEAEPKRVGILGREYFFRVNSYGLVKTLSTKFN